MLRRPDRDRRAVTAALKAARDRRYHQRHHLHVMLAELEIDQTGLDWLVRHQYLDPVSSPTRRAAEPDTLSVKRCPSFCRSAHGITPKGGAP